MLVRKVTISAPSAIEDDEPAFFDVDLAEAGGDKLMLSINGQTDVLVDVQDLRDAIAFLVDREVSE